MTASAHSIRRRLLAKLMIPLLALAIIGSGSAYAIAHYYSQLALDQWLYDSAVTLAHQLHWVGNRTQVDLSGSAREIFELDLTDRIYYEVTSERAGRVFANATLDGPFSAPQVGGEPVYYDAVVNGTKVRAIALAIVSPSNDRIVIKVAETRIKRNRLAHEVFFDTLLLALVMVAGSVALIWRGIGSGLRTLERTVHEIRLRHDVDPQARLPSREEVPLEVRPLIDEINGLIASLERAYRSQHRFVVDAAHQLRTPLASLRVQLDLALRGTGDKRALENAVHAVARMSHLVHQLLALARAEGDENAGSMGPVDVVGLVRAEVERQWDRASAAGSDLGYSGPSSGLVVTGVEALLREAVGNLIDNAIRYASPGVITVGVDPSAAEIHVEDQGPGIAATYRERVLDRFYRIPETPGDGSGLGLAIVAEIVRRHDAVIDITGGEAGRGMRVSIRFKHVVTPTRAAGGA